MEVLLERGVVGMPLLHFVTNSDKTWCLLTCKQIMVDLHLTLRMLTATEHLTACQTSLPERARGEI